MQQEDTTSQILPLLYKHLQVEEGEPLSRKIADEKGMAELKHLLTSQIAWMLDHQFERLLQAMYRIDVNEEEFRNVLTGKDPVAESLADLVLKRELQKIQLRERYKSGKLQIVA